MIPVLKGVSEEQFIKEWPLFAGRLWADAQGGVHAVATAIRRAVDIGIRAERLQVEKRPEPLAALGKKLDTQDTAENLLRKGEGVKLFADDVDGRFSKLEEILKASQSRTMQFMIARNDPRDGRHSIRVRMPYGLTFRARYFNNWGNDAKDAILRYTISEASPGEQEEPEQIEEGCFRPWFYDGAAGWFADGDYAKIPIVPENLLIGRSRRILRPKPKPASDLPAP
jgi:hypothetical protein